MLVLGQTVLGLCYSSVKRIQHHPILLNSTICWTILNELAKRILPCCSRLRAKEKLNQHHSTRWPDPINMSSSTMLME